MTTQASFKPLPLKDFLNLGLNQIVYVKHIQDGPDSSYTLHAANGAEIFTGQTQAEALQAARMNDMRPVTLH